MSRRMVYEPSRPSQRMTLHHRDLFEEIVENLPDWEGRLKSGLSFFARRGPANRVPSPPSLRSGGPPSWEHSGGNTKASFACYSRPAPSWGDKELAASNPGKTRTLFPNPNPNPNGFFCDVINII